MGTPAGRRLRLLLRFVGQACFSLGTSRLRLVFPHRETRNGGEVECRCTDSPSEGRPQARWPTKRRSSRDLATGPRLLHEGETTAWQLAQSAHAQRRRSGPRFSDPINWLRFAPIVTI